MTSLKNVNKVMLLGNIGAKPMLRTTESGQQVANISLATNHRVKKADGDYEEKTYWHKVVVWGKKAQVCFDYLDTGTRIYVEGSLQPKEWTDKNGIVNRSSEIVADDIKFLGYKNAENTLAS